MTDRSADWDGDGADSTGGASAQSPSTRVAFRLASESEQSIDELRPLADSIDPEALDGLFAGRSVSGARVRFRHAGYAITVTGGGDVQVDPVDGE